MEFRSKFRSRHYSASFLTAWLALSLFGLHMLVTSEIKKGEQQFAQDIHLISTEIRQKLLTNDDVLSGFSAFLQAVEKNDLNAAARYANAVLAPHPHIYMLEVARQLSPVEKSSFEESIRKNGEKTFFIRNFADLADHTRDNETPPSSLPKAIWPIVFMFPEHPAAEKIYGVRLETVPYLNKILRLAPQLDRAIASPVFELNEGGTAYILLRHVQRTATASQSLSAELFGDSMAALLLNKASGLHPANLANKNIGLSAELFSEAASESSLLFKDERPAANWADRLTLPLFSQVVESGNDSQPIRLTFERQLGWADIFSANNFAIVGVLLAGILLVGINMQRHHRTIRNAAIEHEHAEYLATHDPLTKLPNRHLLTDRFEQQLHRFERHGTKFALFIVDLDHFKAINDSFGHEAGDAVLVTTAARIAGAIRASDTVARYGGDEFVVLVADVLNSADALALGEKLCALLGEPVTWGKKTIQLTCSLGIALCPDAGKTFNTLFRQADQAMYQVKQRGRNGALLAANAD